ncbi:hypothetical protein, partial [Actinosynnema sp.]|uniref:hypothetical protein n=1 Tax=Actinosynnema sp. TaxID=1872144 RepID=UPI003F85A202
MVGLFLVQHVLGVRTQQRVDVKRVASDRFEQSRFGQDVQEAPRLDFRAGHEQDSVIDRQLLIRQRAQKSEQAG